MDEKQKLWAKQVKVALVEQNLSQQKLANIIKVTPPVISDLLNYGKGSDAVKNRINTVLNLKGV